MEWTRAGLVYEPRASTRWGRTHAALPVVDLKASWLYFTGRDDRGRSHIGRARLSLDSFRVGRLERAPVLGPGALGAFDDAGVTTSCLVRSGGQFLLFYTGWSLGASVPFYLQTGLAVSDDGHRFSRLSAAPLLDRCPADPYLNASPWVIVDGRTWRMWYVSGTEWLRRGTNVRHRYHIKYAESSDGLRWRRLGLVCIDYASAQEYAFGRPCVLKDGGRYRMWFSARGRAYRIGYAESDDGLRWRRDDAAGGLPPARVGWDAEMTTYPCVFRHRGRLHMLYNGNGYGATGIGLAVAQ